MSAKSQREIDSIVEQNIEHINPFNRKFFCSEANNAKKRINRIRREAKKSFINQIN